MTHTQLELPPMSDEETKSVLLVIRDQRDNTVAEFGNVKIITEPDPVFFNFCGPIRINFAEPW